MKTSMTLSQMVDRVQEWCGRDAEGLTEDILFSVIFTMINDQDFADDVTREVAETRAEIAKGMQE